MKAIIRIIAVIICLLTVTATALALNSCVTDNPDVTDTTATDTTAPETEAPPTVLDIVKDGKSDFSICYPDEPSKAIIDSASKLQSDIKNYTGASLAINSDFLGWDGAPDPNKPEILIGLTNREESIIASEGLKYLDYFVGIVGNKIVIVAKSDIAVENAVFYFTREFLRKQNPEVSKNGVITMSSKDNYNYTAIYKITSFECLSKPMGDYRIVIPSSPTITEERQSVAFRDYIATKCGYYLDIVSDSEEATEREILFGKTSRSTISAGEQEFVITADGTKVQIAADSVFSYDAFMDYFKAQIAPQNKESAVIASGLSVTQSVTEGWSGKLAKETDVRIIINNILGNCDTTLYPVPQRTKMITELFLQYKPDVLGLQECSPNSRIASANVATLLSPEYKEVPVRVTNSNGINYTPLFYRTSTVKVVESGYHLFSDGMNDKSKSITWAVFEVISSGKRFAVCSTHFYYKSEANAARLLDAAQLIKVVSDITAKYANIPVFSGGDFNCNLSSEPYAALIKAEFVDVQKTATVTDNTKTTHSYPEFNNSTGFYDKFTFPSGDYNSAIDHIFLSNGHAKVEYFDVVTDIYALLSADHTPLICDFNFTE